MKTVLENCEQTENFPGLAQYRLFWLNIIRISQFEAEKTKDVVSFGENIKKQLAFIVSYAIIKIQ